MKSMHKDNPKAIAEIVKTAFREMSLPTLDKKIWREIKDLAEHDLQIYTSVVEATMPFLFFAMFRSGLEVPVNKERVLRSLIVAVSMNFICGNKVRIDLRRENDPEPSFYPLCLLQKCWVGIEPEEIAAKCQSEWVTAGWKLNVLAQRKDKDNQWNLPKRFDREKVIRWDSADNYPPYWIGAQLIKNELYPEFSDEELILQPMDDQNLDDCERVLAVVDFYKKYPIGTLFCVKGMLLQNESEKKVFLMTGEEDSYAVVNFNWCCNQIWDRRLGRSSQGIVFPATGTKNDIDISHRKQADSMKLSAK